MRIQIITFLVVIFAALQADPIKVPNELYKGYYDKSNHPGHYPFISYLTFRNHCDHWIDDQAEWFDPAEVKRGNTIYLNLWYLGWFLKHVHDRIPYPYILVTGDVGAWHPALEVKKLLYDPKLAAWFCRNLVFSYHPKLFQLPMGQDLGLFSSDPAATNILKAALSKKIPPKRHLLYMNHLPRKHGDRDLIVTFFENEPYCYR